jgi:hypothetical protein
LLTIDMVAGSQKQKCGLKYVIYTFQNKKAGSLLTLPMISDSRFVCYCWFYPKSLCLHLVKIYSTTTL